MSNLPAVLHNSALAASLASLLYTATVTTAALTALIARTPQRRRNAQDVLKILILSRGNKRT
ncbi:hypothetical protein [Phytohabitans aurantiacus]|jgi:hypothetical protein|uniref:Uncharacterized protein n=1 Tax=Phytohabitans aurantiacus TaxID=3016789 RepID=A0ABQ5R0M2_9ACTN|nr:hypothetical protein [Phytohabitans aurantiacus]GLI00240.1 hypothetical protein Pa4123_55160 [Phytohabitans aurantiacus]